MWKTKSILVALLLLSLDAANLAEEKAYGQQQQQQGWQRVTGGEYVSNANKTYTCRVQYSLIAELRYQVARSNHNRTLQNCKI